MKTKKKGFFARLFSKWTNKEKNSKKNENKSRGVDSSNVKGSTGVQSTLDKLNVK